MNAGGLCAFLVSLSLLSACGGNSQAGADPDDIVEDVDGPIILSDMPGYRPLTAIFPDPAEIVRSPDIEGTLAKLRSIASPTMEYHRELYRLAESAQNLDIPHLQLLLDACYYPISQYELIETELKALEAVNDRPTRVRRAELRRDQNLAMTLASLHNQILNYGIPKIEGLDLETGFTLLRKLYRSANGYAAFDYIFRRFSPLSQEQKFAIIEVASDKNENSVAATMAMDWFELESDKSVKALVDLALKLKNTGRDRLLFKGLEAIEKVTTDDILLLASAAYQEPGRLAGRAHIKTKTFSHAGVIKIATALVGAQKDIFLDLAMDVYAWMAVYHVREVIEASHSRSAALAIEGSGLLKEFRSKEALEYVRMLSGSDKDIYLLEAVLKVLDLNEETLATLGAEAYEKREEILAKGRARLRGDLQPERPLPPTPITPPEESTDPPATPDLPPSDVAPPTEPPTGGETAPAEGETPVPPAEETPPAEGETPPT
jgi:hypothetical protein